MGVGGRGGRLGVRRILHGTETLFRIFVATTSVTTAKLYGLGVVQNNGKSRRMPQLQENCQKPIRRAFHKLMICRESTIGRVVGNKRKLYCRQQITWSKITATFS